MLRGQIAYDIDADSSTDNNLQFVHGGFWSRRNSYEYIPEKSKVSPRYGRETFKHFNLADSADPTSFTFSENKISTLSDYYKPSDKPSDKPTPNDPNLRYSIYEMPTTHVSTSYFNSSDTGSQIPSLQLSSGNQGYRNDRLMAGKDYRQAIRATPNQDSSSSFPLDGFAPPRSRQEHRLEATQYSTFNRNVAALESVAALERQNVHTGSIPPATFSEKNCPLCGSSSGKITIRRLKSSVAYYKIKSQAFERGSLALHALRGILH